MKRTLTWRTRSYAAHKPFTIARGTKSCADQLIVTIMQGGYTGTGACVPYPRYGESCASVAAAIKAVQSDIENGLGSDELQKAMPPGAARNAVDCALWDLRAKLEATPVWALAGLGPPQPRATAITLSVGTPQDVGREAARLAHYPLLKLKLAGDALDTRRIDAAFASAPEARFILDANEALTRATLATLVAHTPLHRLALIEQPVTAGDDASLQGFVHKGLLCADESFHTHLDIEPLAPFYGAVNIKLDKTGGFTEALAAALLARQKGLKVMLGCMLGSSLAMAPAFMLAPLADYIDLDGPLLLAQDDDPGFQFTDSTMHPSNIWGIPK